MDEFREKIFRNNQCIYDFTIYSINVSDEELEKLGKDFENASK